MKITMSNAEMAGMIEVMAGLHETGKLGYAIARNMRRMKDAATEYLNLRAELFQKYGKPGKKNTMVISAGEPMQKYLADMGDIPQIKHEVEIYAIPEETFSSGSLTSGQMEALLWMVEEEE